MPIQRRSNRHLMLQVSVVLALIVPLFGCKHDLANAPCPCVQGFQCCATRNICIPAEASCAASGGASDAGPLDPRRGSDATPHTLQGCAVDASVSSKVAPGGYYTNGASVCTASGAVHLFHGVDRPSLEWNSWGQWDGNLGIPRSDFDAMAAWHANVVRLSLNQGYWLSGSKSYAPAYEATIEQAVQDAEAAGLDVILDLQWSDRGNRNADADQQPMADSNSKEFWRQVATKYKADGHVLFELYNEPHDITWTTWLSGGEVDEYQAVGMQELYDTVRSVGADNLVIIGGTAWGFDLSGVPAHRIQGYNVMYATHPFGPHSAQSQWDRKFGYLAAQDIAPVIATAFGDMGTNCTGDWNSKVVQYADARQISWTAWAWWPGDCTFPALLEDWTYTPTEQGAAIQAALLNYPY